MHVNYVGVLSIYLFVSFSSFLLKGGHLVTLVLGKDSEGRSSMCIPGGHETLATIAKQLISENVFTKVKVIVLLVIFTSRISQRNF